MVGLEGDLKAYPPQAPAVVWLPLPAQAAQDPIQPSLECFQGIKSAAAESTEGRGHRSIQPGGKCGLEMHQNQPASRSVHFLISGIIYCWKFNKLLVFSIYYL